MEKLALEIIDCHILEMTDNNYYEWCEYNSFLEAPKIINNLKNGFVLLTQLVCYVEASLNTILNQCIQTNTSHIINSSIENKLEFICAYYHINMNQIVGSTEWQEFHDAKQIRNEMIHHKRDDVGMGVGIPDFCLGKKNVGEYFTKSNFLKLIEAHKELVKKIVDLCKLQIFEDIDIFDMNGMDCMHWYIYNPKINPIGPGRIEWIQKKKRNAAEADDDDNKK